MAIKLLKSYLTNGFSIIGKGSQKIFIATRVLQGSTLGPFFFLVYVNDLTLCFNLDTLMYADDTVLTISSYTLTNLTEHCSILTKKNSEWYEVSKLT